MAIGIKSGGGVNIANVSSASGITVNLPTELNLAGYSTLVGEVDDGSVMGYKTLRPYYITQDYRTLKNLEAPIWQDSFNYSNLNNYKYKLTTLNQNITLSGNSVNLNSNLTTGNGDFSIIQTFKTFSLIENGPTYVNFKTSFASAFTSNNIIEFGLGLVTGTVSARDGVFFRVSGGTLNAVVSYSGLETTQINIYTPVVGQNDDYLLAISDGDAEFWVNDIMVARVVPTATTVTFTSTTEYITSPNYCVSSPNSLNLFMRTYNSGVPSSAVKVSFSSINVLFGDYKSNKNYGLIMSNMGDSSINNPNGSDFVSSGNISANITNNLGPEATLYSNSSGAYKTLGGDFSLLARNGGETDNIVFSYVNPTGTAGIPAKNLIIRDIYIDTYTSGATVGGTGTTLQWLVAVGGTSEDLATSDSVTDGTRAPRRLSLGVQTFPASSAIGAIATPIQYTGSNTLIVEPRSYLHIIFKIVVGLTTGSLYYRGNVTINGYWD